ncbi:unnamed protein product [Musa hybrid cultivar]
MIEVAGTFRCAERGRIEEEGGTGAQVFHQDRGYVHGNADPLQENRGTGKAAHLGRRQTEVDVSAAPPRAAEQKGPRHLGRCPAIVQRGVNDLRGTDAVEPRYK